MMRIIPVAAALATMISVAAQAQEHPPAPTGRPAGQSSERMKRLDPLLGRYTDDILYGDVWTRPILGPRERSIAVVTAAATLGRLVQLEHHIERALDNGVTPAEIGGLATQIAFYAGWPAAVNTLEVAEKVFQQRKLDISGLARVPGPLLPAPPPDDASIRQTARTVAPVAPRLTELNGQLIEGELWRQPDLAPRDRSLVTIAVLITQGPENALAAEIRRGLVNGLTRAAIGEEITQLAFYAGFPHAANAAAVAKTVFDSQPASAAAGLSVTHEGNGPPGESAAHFTGGDASLTPIAMPGTTLRSSIVRFRPGARTRWHSHPYGQLIVVTGGRGWIQSEGDPVHAIGTGDVIWTPPGVRHWHGATRETALSQLALGDTGTGLQVQWGEPVSEAQYRGPASEPAGATARSAGKGLHVYQDVGRPLVETPQHLTGGAAALSPVDLSGSKMQGAIVTFEPGSRTRWHSHPNGQLLIVTGGRGLVQSEGQPARIVTTGDVVWTPPGVMHWHGATRESWTTQVAAADTGGGKPTIWGEPVTDAEFDATR